jgi:hypothetical protein
VRTGRSRRGAPAFVNVYGQARQHAGALDGGSRQAVQRQGPEVPADMRLDSDEMDRQVLGHPVTRGFGEPWIDLEEDKSGSVRVAG